MDLSTAAPTFGSGLNTELFSEGWENDKLDGWHNDTDVVSSGGSNDAGTSTTVVDTGSASAYVKANDGSDGGEVAREIQSENQFTIEKNQSITVRANLRIKWSGSVADSSDCYFGSGNGAEHTQATIRLENDNDNTLLLFGRWLDCPKLKWKTGGSWIWSKGDRDEDTGVHDFANNGGETIEWTDVKVTVNQSTRLTKLYLNGTHVHTAALKPGALISDKNVNVSLYASANSQDEDSPTFQIWAENVTVDGHGVANGTGASAPSSKTTDWRDSFEDADKVEYTEDGAGQDTIPTWEASAKSGDVDEGHIGAYFKIEDEGSGTYELGGNYDWVSPSNVSFGTDSGFTVEFNASMGKKANGGGGNHMEAGVVLLNGSRTIEIMEYSSDGTSSYDYRVKGNGLENKKVDHPSNGFDYYRVEFDRSAGEYRAYVNDTLFFTGNITGTLNASYQPRIRLGSGGSNQDNQNIRMTMDNLHIYKGLPTSPKTVSGTVENQNGDPVSNATVQVWGVDYDQITPDSGESKKEEAIDQIESAKNKTPSEWTSQVENNFQLQTAPGIPDRGTGHFETVENPYVAVHAITDWKRSKYSEGVKGNPKLQNPLLTKSVSEGEAVTLAVSVWDPEKSSLRNAVSPVKQDLPGEPIEKSVVIETLIASNDTVSDIKTTETVINCNFLGCDWSDAFVEVALTPGIYRVYPEGNAETSYLIKVGNPIEIISEDLKNKDEQVADQASDVAKDLTNGRFTKTTTTTNATGYFSVDVGSSVKTVAIQAYKAPDVSQNDSSLKPNDVFQNYSDSYEDGKMQERLGSTYMPSEIERVDPPKSGVTVVMEELTYPPYADVEDVDDILDDRLDELLNETLSDMFGSFLERLEDVNRTDLENIYETLTDLYEQNQRLRERVDEIDEASNKSLVIKENATNVNRSELEDTIEQLNEAIEQLESELEADVEEDIGASNISQRWTFDKDIKEESVTLLIHWSNGTTTTLTPDSDYLSVNKRTGFGDQVILDEYPLNDTDPATLTFELLVVGEEGEIGRERNTVRNPNFDGDIPKLDSIRLTSLEPGPSQQIDVELNPEDPAKFGSIVNVTVHGPDGSELSTDPISSDGKSSGFKTNGKGVHHISITFNNSDGDEFTETLRIKADNYKDDRPSSAQIRTGSTGRYLLVGDGLEGGTIDVADDGAISVALQIAQDADTPNALQVYLQSIETGSRKVATVRLVRGDSEQAVSKQIDVIMHMDQITDNAVLYRGEKGALPRDGRNENGIVDARDNGTTIRSYSGDNGAVTVTVENDPGLVERVIYELRVRGLTLPTGAIVPIGIFDLFDDLGLDPGGTAGFGGLIVGTLAWKRRGWSL